MRPLDISPLLIHGVFFVSLTTTAGLVAVWTALSPWHRLVRVAGFCALPAAMSLVSAPDLAKDLLLEMAAIAILIIVTRFVARAPYGRTYAKLPRVRFGLGALFYAIFLAALVLGAASLLRPQFADWAARDILRWLLEQISLALAIVGAAYFAGGGGWTKRLAALFAGCLAGAAGWFGLRVVSSVIPGMFAAFILDATTWTTTDSRYVALVPSFVGGLAAGILGTLRHSGTSQPAAGNRCAPLPFRVRTRTAVGVAMIACVSLPSCYMYYELARPIAPPQADMPSPNGYDQLVAVGEQLGDQGITSRRRDELLNEARSCLALPSCVHLDDSESDTSRSQALRTVFGRLREAADAQRDSGSVDAALALYLDVFGLADRTQHGGIVNDALCAYAYESVDGLASLLPRLSVGQCRTAIGQLLAYDDDRDAVEDILHRDDVRSRVRFGWFGRWWRTVETIPKKRKEDWDHLIGYDPRKRAQARLRVGICDLAIHAFLFDRERLPESLDELVPTYLPYVPIDPYDGQPVRFSIEGDEYTISTVDGGVGGEGPVVIVRKIGDE